MATRVFSVTVISLLKDKRTWFIHIFLRYYLSENTTISSLRCFPEGTAIVSALSANAKCITAENPSPSICCVIRTEMRRERRLQGLLEIEKCFLAGKHNFWQMLLQCPCIFLMEHLPSKLRICILVSADLFRRLRRPGHDITYMAQ